MARLVSSVLLKNSWAFEVVEKSRNFLLIIRGQKEKGGRFGARMR